MTQSRVALLVLTTVLTMPFSFGLTQGDDAETLETAEELAQQWEDAVSQQDAAAIAQLFTEDGQFISAAGEVFMGRQAIQENQEVSFSEFGLSEVSLPVTEASFSADLGYAAGTFAARGPEGEDFGEGYWLTIYVQEGGEWKILRTMSTNKPAPEEGTATGGTMTGGGN